MPLFVLISGYLFSFLLQLGKYPTWVNLLQKKGFRILLPYFVFGLFFMYTTGNWHPLRLLEGGYWHLWFLPMLFWCFIAGYGMNKIKLNVYAEVTILQLIWLFCLFMSKFVPMWLGLNSVGNWFFWFYLGMLVFKYKKRLFKSLNKNKLLWVLLFLSCAIICLFPVEYGKSTWYSKFVVTGCVVAISCLMDKLDWSKFKVTAPLVKFSSYSFGIYIWHNWVALMLISKTSQHLLGLPELAANHVVLFPLCFSLITLFISWGISWCMMKTKVGKFLIG